MFPIRKSNLKEYQQMLDRYKTDNPHDDERATFNYLSKGIEAIKKHLKLTPFNEQIIGAFALAKDNIAEMKTGEGKTITAALAAIMTAHQDQVMVITVNDYLATRDYNELKSVYEDCGYTVGLVTHSQTPYRKKSAYQADIVYVTNSELGFDILRDNTATSLEDRVISRPLTRTIIDEVDAVLIDDARTPLILSGNAAPIVPDARYIQADRIAAGLKNEHVVINRKARTAHLTESGHKVVCSKLNINNLYTYDNVLNAHLISNALKARFIERDSVEYLVKNGKIELIDQMGGRVLDGRRYNDGLMQALEAKERLEIQGESRTLASITYQNLARMFKHVSGMTGTAHSEAKEFKELYNLNVVQIPTHKPMIRKDHEDQVFDTQAEVLRALLQLVRHVSEKGQPLLIAADSTKRAETLAREFTNANIKTTLLTARDASKEAPIISAAGRDYSILVTTALAGRGTDIVLQGKIAKEYGLYVIGVGRGRSKRVDDQLRGRSGRQGDPGESIFFVSREDDLFDVIDNPQTTRSGDIKWSLYTPDYVQKMSEAKDFDSRKNTLEYDDVLREQRAAVYEMREQILSKDLDMSLTLEVSKLAKRANCTAEEIEALEEATKHLLTIKRFRAVRLNILDNNWSEYMSKLDYLKDAMSYRSYAGRNPLIDFQGEAKELFESFLALTRKDVCNALLEAPVARKPKAKIPTKASGMRQFAKSKLKK